MNLSYCKWFFLLFPISLLSCNQHTTSPYEEQLRGITDTIPESFVSKSDTLKFEKTGYIGDDVYTMATADTFILIANVKAPRALTILSTESHRPLTEIIPRGKGKGNCLSVSTIMNTSDSNVVWLYDVTAVKFMKINLQKAIMGDGYSSEKEFITDKPALAVKSPCWINDSTYAGCSYFSDEERFILFNDKFQPSKRIGILPPSLPAWPDENPKGKFALRALGYSGNLVKQPEKNRYAIVYNTTSRIEFYDSSNLVKVIRGPGLFDPVYKFKEFEGVHIPQVSNETVISFVEAKADNNYIYLLYSGKKKKHSGRQLLILDWKGNPVKLYNMGGNYRTFSIAQKGNRKRIYAINENTGDLEYSEISI